MPGEEVAFVGLGAMGFGMATSLLKKGFSVTGFDLWPRCRERFAEAGGKVATSPREAAKGVRYLVFMVATAAQIVEALFDEETGAIWDLPKDAVVVLSSTGPPEHSANVRRLLDGKYARPDVHVVDAPVSGGTIRAAAGTLTILASGPAEAVEHARPVLDGMAGDKLRLIEGGLGAGTKVKMVHQVLAGVHIVMASEAMGFAALLGLNTREVVEYLKGSEAQSWMFENRAPHMLEEDDTVYSAVNIITKDIGIVTGGGRAEKFPLFLASATEQVLASAVSAGYGLADDCNLTKVYILKKDLDMVQLQAHAPLGTKADYAKLRLVATAMEAVHLAAAAEAMALGAKVGLDVRQLQEIIETAAGSSWMFVDRVPQMLSGEWRSTRMIDDVIGELTKSIAEANNLKYPLHLAGTALQLFQLAALRGLGKEADVAVCRVWDGTKGSPFPGGK